MEDLVLVGRFELICTCRRDLCDVDWAMVSSSLDLQSQFFDFSTFSNWSVGHHRSEKFYFPSNHCGVRVSYSIVLILP